MTIIERNFDLTKTREALFETLCHFRLSHCFAEAFGAKKKVFDLDTMVNKACEYEPNGAFLF